MPSRTSFVLLAACSFLCVLFSQAASESSVLHALNGLVKASEVQGSSVSAHDLLLASPEHTTELPSFQQLPRKTRGELLHQVGELHLLGCGAVSRNTTHASLFLQVSADAYGNPAAQFLLGALHSAGDDIAKAQLNYEFAARGGSLHASMALGYRALHGYGSRKSCEAALHHYKSVADRVVSQQDSQQPQLYAFPEPVRLSDNADASHSTDLNPAEDFQRAEYLRQRAAFSDNAELLQQSASITLFSDLYLGLEDPNDLREHADRQREAKRFLERAVELGSVAAQALLGHVYAYGLADCIRNATHAMELYEAALNASQGNPNGEAANGLGKLYAEGIGGVPVNLERARNLFELASSAGHADGVYNTGMSLLGLGLQYAPRAQEYLAAAAHVGHLKSVFQLARLQERQIPGYYDIGGSTSSGITCEEVVLLYKQVSEHSREGAALMTRALALSQHGSLDVALELYSLAAEMGYESAQSNAAWLMERQRGLVFGGVDFKRSTAYDRRYAQLVHRAAKQDSADALVRLGDIAFHDGDYQAAMQKYQYADLVSAGSCARALFSVGYMYEHGLGVASKSSRRATLYYQLSGEAEPVLSGIMKLLQFKLRVVEAVQWFLRTTRPAWLVREPSTEAAPPDMDSTPLSSTLGPSGLKKSAELGQQNLQTPATSPAKGSLTSTLNSMVESESSLTDETAQEPTNAGASVNNLVEVAPALQFLGAQSRLLLELAHGELLLENQDFTIEAWMFIDKSDSMEAQSGGSHRRVVTLVDALDNFQLELLGPKIDDKDASWTLRFRKFSLLDKQHPELAVTFSSAPLPPGMWHHVAVTFEARFQTVSLLLNAKVKQTLSFRPRAAAALGRNEELTSKDMLSSSRLLAIGSSLSRLHGATGQESTCFSGQLVHFRLWTTRKNSAEVRVLMMEQYESVPTPQSRRTKKPELLVHLGYELRSQSSSKVQQTEENGSTIMNGGHAVTNAHGVELKTVVFPPPYDEPTSTDRSTR